MKKYLYVSPRGFRNEFSIYAVSPEAVGAALKIINKYSGDPNGRAQFIHRREAEKLVASQRRQAHANKRAGLSPCANPVGATEIADLAEEIRLQRTYEI